MSLTSSHQFKNFESEDSETLGSDVEMTGLGANFAQSQ